MKVRRLGLCTIAFVLGCFTVPGALAQAPAGAPAGSTGQCKDGTYTKVTTKRGACRGHKGVQTWYVATPAAPASAPPAAAPSAAPAAPAAHASKTAKTNVAQAPGGGPGLVWLNTGSNVYHCPGTKYYGKTKAGKYVTEAQAKAAGGRPEHGKGCGQ